MNEVLFQESNSFFYKLLIVSIIVHAGLLYWVKTSPVQKKIETKYFELELAPVPKKKIIPKTIVKKKIKKVIVVNKKKPLIQKKSIKKVQANSKTQSTVQANKKKVRIAPKMNLGKSPFTKLSQQSSTKDKFGSGKLQPQKLGNQQDLPANNGEIPRSTGDKTHQNSQPTKKFGLENAKGGGRPNIPLSQKQQYGLEKKILKKNSIAGNIKVRGKNQKKAQSQSKKQGWGGTLFTGEIRNRKLLYAPPAPKLNLEKNIKISLKFTVLPSGMVDQVFPVIKGNPELERIATRNLRKYRFQALAGSTKIQSGTIHFSIQRKIVG
ncbi:MAG: hypothetical protein ACI86H_002355 [bacterium]|jgi:hypothetical protein